MTSEKTAILLKTAALLIVVHFLVTAVGGQVPEILVRGHPSAGEGIWNSEDFGWFYYDLDEGVGGECLQIVTEDRHVDEGQIVYSNRIWTERFDHEEWGSYQAVAFLGRRYLAGYPESDLTHRVSSIEDGELREVLIDDGGTYTITSERPLVLGDGYLMTVAGVSSDGNEAYLVLQKNQEIVDEVVVGVGDTYVYEVGEDDLPVLLVRVSRAFGGRGSEIVDVDGIFQVQDPPMIHLETGEVLDSMEVTVLSNQMIELENHEGLILRRNSNITLIDGLMLRVRDKSSLEYYPVGSISRYGVQQIRGPIYTENSLLQFLYYDGSIGYAEAKWNYRDFSGFYFGDETYTGSESLTLYITDNRIISPIYEFIMNGTRLGYGLKYNSYVEPVEFEYDDWGTYDVICLFSQLWFVGYGPGTGPDIGRVSMLEYDMIGQVLIDTDLMDKALAGEVYFLKDGYELYIRDLVKGDVEEDKIFVELVKSGEVLDSAVIGSNSTYVYEKDVGDVDDLPIIVVRVGSIFSDEREQFAVIEGLFQVSDRLFLSVERNNDFGEVTVLAVTPDYIIMGNPDWIELKRDSDVGIWPGMYIAVADNDTLRYRLYTNEYVVPPPRIMSVALPPEAVLPSRPANFSMAVLGGDIKRASAEILDSDGRSILLADLTSAGLGSEDRWLYFWQWDATMLALSDDGSLLPITPVHMGVLYPNESSSPVQVLVQFGPAERIDLIQDLSDVIYYISPSAYESAGFQVGYDQMLEDDAIRHRYVKIESGVSKIRFYDIVDGNAVLRENNHTLGGDLASIEPHLVWVDAPSGRYELRLNVENVMGSARATGIYFDGAGADGRSIFVGSGTVEMGGTVAVPLEMGLAEGVKGVEITYDPEVLKAGFISGECPVQSHVDDQGGRISLEVPGDCRYVNITFVAREITTTTTTEIGIAKVVGIEVDEVINGTVIVLAEEGERSEEQGEKSCGPSALVALMALGLVAGLVGRRR